ncbi:hypothetical protein BJV74DRAFT_795391 [Russula compacta]|nr:hypothetical protein BJV74DRAFT_795391 [Russula compacta]
MDLEDEELDTVIKKSGKKQKAGVGMRDCINKAAAGLTQRDIGLNLEVQKWKAGSDSEVGARPTPRKAWKTKGSEALSGLVPGWKKIINVTSQPAGTMCTSAKSTATISHPPTSMVSTSTARSCCTAFTAMSIHQANSSAPSATNWCDEPGPSVGPNDRPAFTYGGLPSDEEEVRPQDPKLVNKHWSITRVHKIHTSPLHTKAKVSQQADSNTGCHRVKNSDLPPHTIGHFTKDVLPLAFEVTGTLHPWEYPSDEQIIAIWNLVFENDHPIVSGDVKGELFLAVKGLVKQGISTWLHKFAIAAEGALVSEFEQQDISKIEEKVKFIQFLLGDMDNISSKHHPFLWKTAYNLRENSDSAKPHRFQMSSQLAHSSYPSKPHVHCALLYSTKGSFNPPHSKPGAFLKANWGNYNVVSQKGTVTAVKHASVFLKRIQALKDQQWIDIYATALENHEMDDEVGSGGDGVRSGTSSKDELLDPLYDDIPA